MIKIAGKADGMGMTILKNNFKIIIEIGESA